MSSLPAQRPLWQLNPVLSASFYGESQPLGTYDPTKLSLLNAQQALADAATFILWVQETNNCTGLNGQPRCPVVTFGGSYDTRFLLRLFLHSCFFFSFPSRYPGWLSAMMRIRYPGIVDFAYSASAPMLFYSQQVVAALGRERKGHQSFQK